MKDRRISDDTVCITCRKAFLSPRDTTIACVQTKQGYAIFRLCRDCASHANTHRRLSEVREAAKAEYV